MKKLTSGFLCLSALALALPTAVRAEDSRPSTILVCRARQCAEAAYSMSKGFLFNKIAQMMKNNVGKSVLICEADPTYHVCLEEGITIPVEAAFNGDKVTISGLTLTDEKMVTDKTALDVVFDYKIRTNNTYPNCQLSVARLTVDYLDKIEMATKDTICDITETGHTSLNATYNIDYLDFDYGFIGAHYTVGVGEAVKGDKSGYVLMRFTHQPELSLDEPANPTPEDTFPNSIKAANQASAQTNSGIDYDITTSPAILRDTKPAAPFMPHTIKFPKPDQEHISQLPPEPSTNHEEVAEVTFKETPQEPTVIKTTVVEKTVITSDGKRTTKPPVTRTIVNGVPQQ